MRRFSATMVTHKKRIWIVSIWGEPPKYCVIPDIFVVFRCTHATKLNAVYAIQANKTAHLGRYFKKTCPVMLAGISAPKRLKIVGAIWSWSISAS